jgi:hypothetical protein
LVNEYQNCHDPNGKRTFEKNFEVSGIEMVKPFWEFRSWLSVMVGEIGMVDLFELDRIARRRFMLKFWHLEIGALKLAP